MEEIITVFHILKDVCEKAEDASEKKQNQNKSSCIRLYKALRAERVTLTFFSKPQEGLRADPQLQQPRGITTTGKRAQAQSECHYFRHATNQSKVNYFPCHKTGGSSKVQSSMPGKPVFEIKIE